MIGLEKFKETIICEAETLIGDIPKYNVEGRPEFIKETLVTHIKLVNEYKSHMLIVKVE